MKFIELPFLILELCSFIVLLVFIFSFAVFDYSDSIFFRFSKAPELPPPKHI